MEWIDFNKQKPKYLEDVLFLTDSGVIEGYYNPNWYTEFYFNFSCGCSSENIGIVTHWMPLPEPPKENES